MEASALRAPAYLGRLSAGGRLLRLRSDDQLVALFRQGHEEAFGAIHDRYRQRLFAYTRQMLAGSRSDAEDALQDVFLRAYRALREDDRPVTLRAWLYRVAHNRCVDQLRRPLPLPSEVFDVSRTPLRDPLDETARREELRRLVDDVRRLPEQQRSALLMRELEGLSYNELAGALDVTVPAVKSLLVRARVGLVEAGEARDAACTEIRADLAAASSRGVRAPSRARRHLHDCAGCRGYRSALRGVHNGFGALSGGHGALVTVAKLLGLGGAGSSAAVGGGAAVGGAAATKVAAFVCCAAVVGGSAVEMPRAIDAVTPSPPSHAAPKAVAKATPAARAASAPALTAHPRVVGAPAAQPATSKRRTRPAAKRSKRRAVAERHHAPAGAAQGGGVLAPAEATAAPAASTPAVPIAGGAAPVAPAPDAAPAGASEPASTGGATPGQAAAPAAADQAAPSSGGAALAPAATAGEAPDPAAAGGAGVPRGDGS